MILLPLYLQNARGFTAIESGLLMLPGAVLMGLLSPVAGKLFDQFGAKWITIIGIVITIGATLPFIYLTDSTGFTYLLVMSTVRRIGIALLITPIQTAGLNQLPASYGAHGTAIWNTMRQVAGAVGTSLLVTVMTSSTKTHLQSLMAHGGASGETQQHMVMEASIHGVNDAYFVIIVIGVISLLLSFFIKRVEQAPEDSAIPLKSQKVAEAK
jgi:MFS family permease